MVFWVATQIILIIRHLESLPKKRSSGYHLKKKKTSEPRISLLRESLDTQGELIGVLVLAIQQFTAQGTKNGSDSNEYVARVSPRSVKALVGWATGKRLSITFYPNYVLL